MSSVCQNIKVVISSGPPLNRGGLAQMRVINNIATLTFYNNKTLTIPFENLLATPGFSILSDTKCGWLVDDEFVEKWCGQVAKTIDYQSFTELPWKEEWSKEKKLRNKSIQE